MKKKEFLKMVKYGEIDDNLQAWGKVYDSIFNEGKKEAVDILTKKTTNEKGEPICPKCDKDMERDVQEPQGYLWFCKCSPSLRLSVG